MQRAGLSLSRRVGSTRLRAASSSTSAMAKKSKFNWERLLGPSSVGSAGEGSDAGDGSARAAAGAGAAAAVVRVQSEQQLARLWAGYGSIKSLKVEVTPRGGGAAAVRHLVAKAVDPPRGLAGDAGHQRKLDSYAVEVRARLGVWGYGADHPVGVLLLRLARGGG